MAAIKHYHPLWSSLAMLIHGPPLYPELKPIITIRTSLLISFIFVLVLLWYIYLCCDKSNILVWDLLIPQPWVLIITNTRKVSISSPFNKYLSNNYWSATEVMIDKVGVIVCMRWKPNPSMCGYDIRELRHMWPAWEHHHPLSAPISTTQQLYPPIPDICRPVVQMVGSVGVPGLLSKHASCLSRWCWHATYSSSDTLVYKHCNGNNRDV